jgi:hypothetical protein
MMASRFEENPVGAIVGLLVENSVFVGALVSKGLITITEVNERVVRIREERAEATYNRIMKWLTEEDPQAGGSAFLPRPDAEDQS